MKKRFGLKRLQDTTNFGNAEAKSGSFFLDEIINAMYSLKDCRFMSPTSAIKRETYGSTTQQPCNMHAINAVDVKLKSKHCSSDYFSQ